MANKKKNNFNSKKKTTPKKSNTSTKKKTTKTTAKKTTSTAVKKKTSVKKVATTTKTTSSKKTSPKKKQSIKVITKEPIKIDKEDINVELPKLKIEGKEVSKNLNEPQRVMKTEEYTIIKKEAVEGRKRISKSNAKRVEKSKKNSFYKTINKLRRKIKMYGISSVFPIKYLILTLIIIGVLIVSPLILNMFNKTKSMDLSAIPEKIDYLKTVSFSIDNVSDIISSSEAYSQLKDYYEYDFKEVFDLNPNYVEEYSIKISKNKKQVFIAIKATEGHHDDVKNSIDNYLKNNEIKDYQYLEYQGYQIYIKSSNNEKVLSKIKQSQKRVFNILQDLKKDEINQLLKISDSDYDEALVKTAMLRTDTCGYIIIKPKNQSSKAKIKNLMDDYYKGLESKWQNNEGNKKLVQNRYFEEYKDYLIYIISHDNDLVSQMIKGK